MFTGLVQEVGRVVSLSQEGDWTFRICAPHTTAKLSLGASVACDGVCLTVIEKDNNNFTVQLSTETLDKTTARDWKIGKEINLEPALRLGDELGGHLVLGHVDGCARLVSRTEEQDSLRLIFEVPQEYLAYVAPKGSICLDGISLTVNEVKDNLFGVNIIPHTQKATTIALKQAGDKLNFEIDPLARYAVHAMKVLEGQ